MSAGADLRAGSLRVLILGELSRGPGYGYGIARALDSASGGELAVRPESLYPVLHRLEAAGLVRASWTVAEGRPRKMYALTPAGKRQWEKQRSALLAAARGTLNALVALGESS